MSIYKEQQASIYDDTSIVPQSLSESVAKSRAAYTALASTGTSKSLLETYRKATQDLSSEGWSGDEQQVLETASAELTQAKTQAAIQISQSDMPVGQRLDAINALKRPQEGAIVNEARIAQAAEYTAPTMETELVREMDLQEQLANTTARRYLESKTLSSEIENMRMRTAVELGDMELYKGVGEIAELVTPFAMQDVYSAVLRDTFPEEDWGQAWVLTGEARVKFKEMFDALPHEEQVERLKIFEESLKENSGLIAENGILAHTVIGEIFGEELGEREAGSFDWDRLWQNTTSVLDLVAVGGLLRAGGKAAKAPLTRIRGGYGRVIDDLDSANPAAARDLRAAVATSQDRDLENLSGLTAEDVFTESYPSFEGAVLNNAPAGVVDAIKDNIAMTKHIEENAVYGINYTEEELIGMRQKAVNATMAKDGYLDMSRSVIKADEFGDKFVIQAAYGASSDSGFANMQRAREHFEANWPEGTKVSYLTREGNTFVEATDDVLARTPDNEVYYRVEATYGYDQSLADADSLLFGDKVVDSSSLVPLFNNKWVKDAASMFDRYLNKALNRAGDYSQGLAHAMNNVVSKSLAPLPMKGKQNVMKLLQEGSEQEIVFRYDELAGNYTTKEIEAYYSLRALSDMQHSLDNRRIYNKLAQENYESVVSDATAFEGIGRKIPDYEGSSGITTAFNPTTGAVEEFTAAQRRDIYDNGGMFAHSKFENRSGNVRSQYIYVDGDKTKVRPLTRFPLPYRKGYMTRGYADNYMIKMRVTDVVDGKKVSRVKTVASAATKEDAMRYLPELKRQFPEAEEIYPQIKRELSDPDVLDDEMELLNMTGGIVSGRRGTLLKSMSDREDQLLDPIESLQKHISYTAGRVAYDDVMATLNQRWVNTYGKKYDVSSVEDYEKINARTSSDTDVANAKAVAEHILGARGVQPEGYKRYRSFMLKMAEHLESTMGGGRVAKSVGDFVRDFNPIKTLRGFTFNMLLATNPARQFLLQSNQITMLAGIDPKAFAKTARGWVGFAAAAATRDTPRWGKARAVGAKLMGITADEFEKLYDGFRVSGLPASINAHTFARDAMPEISARISGSLLEQSARAAFNVTKTPLRLVRQAGFNAGEWNNLSMTYVMSYEMWKKANKGKKLTKLAIADIATEARDLALNMTRTGELNYQRGALSLATQFLSYQHKAILAATGANRKFRELSPLQRTSFLASQFVLYGVDGLGVGAFTDKIISTNGYEVPEEVKPLIDGLVYDYMLNRMLSAVSGEEEEVDFTGDLAPLGGINSSIYGMLANIMEMRLPDVALGASGGALSRFAEAGAMVNFIADIPDMDTPEKLSLAVQQFGQVAGAYNNYVKGHAMRTFDYHLSKSGQPLYRTTSMEGLFVQLFGIGPDAEEEYYRVAQSINGTYAPGSNIDKLRSALIEDDSIEGMARTYYDRVSKLFREASLGSGDLTELDRQSLENQLYLENLLFTVLPEDIAYAVGRHVQNYIAEGISKDGYDELISNIWSTSVRGQAAPSDVQEMLNVISDPNLNLTPRQRADVERMLKYLTGE